MSQPTKDPTRNVVRALVRAKAAVVALLGAFRRPTLKQKEAYGRFCHTLSAALFIGAASIGFTEVAVTIPVIFRLLFMVLVGVILFLFGIIQFEGE